MSDFSPGFRVTRKDVDWERLDIIRRARFLTAEDWYKRAGVDYRSYFRLQRGEVVLLETVEKLARVLGVPVEDALAPKRGSMERVDPESINVDLLDRVRRRLGYRLQTLAKLAGLSDACVRNAFKRGRYFGPPTMRTIRLLADVLDLKLDDVIYTGPKGGK